MSTENAATLMRCWIFEWPFRDWLLESLPIALPVTLSDALNPRQPVPSLNPANRPIDHLMLNLIDAALTLVHYRIDCYRMCPVVPHFRRACRTQLLTEFVQIKWQTNNLLCEKVDFFFNVRIYLVSNWLINTSWNPLVDNSISNEK